MPEARAPFPASVAGLDGNLLDPHPGRHGPLNQLPGEEEIVGAAPVVDRLEKPAGVDPESLVRIVHLEAQYFTSQSIEEKKRRDLPGEHAALEYAGDAAETIAEDEVGSALRHPDRHLYGRGQILSVRMQVDDDVHAQ